MNVRRIILALASAAGLSVAGATLLASPTTATQQGPLPEDRIVSIAMSGAAAAGDSSPAAIEHSEGTRAQANMVASGEGVEGNADSILIVEHGHFTLAHAPMPPGAPAPTGSVLTLVVDAVSGQVTDSGIQDNVPDLASLGPVTVDLPAAAGAASAARPATSARTGVLTGAIRFAGGPPPTHPRSPAAGVVTVFTSTGRALVRQRVAKGHHFRFVLAAGHYQLNAGRSLHPGGGCAPKHAVVHADRRTSVDVETGCNIP